MNSFISCHLKHFLTLVLLLLPKKCLCSTEEEGTSTTQLRQNTKVARGLALCNVNEVLGRTYVAPIFIEKNGLNKYFCFKLELFENGIFQADKSSGSTIKPDCTNAAFAQVYAVSEVDFYDIQKKSFILDDIFDEPTTVNGIVSVREDSAITEIEMNAKTTKFPRNDFEVELVLPSCIAPTPTPSSVLSLSPSQLFSEKPSANPSESPSQQPSENPSMSPSQQPSHAPSVRPSTYPSKLPSKSPSMYPSLTPSQAPSDSPTLPMCPIDQVLGKTYKATMFIPSIGRFFCFRLELFNDGVFEVDTSRAKDCASAKFKQTAQISTFQQANSGDNTISFQAAKVGPYNYAGIFVIREDSSITDVEFESIIPFKKRDDYLIDLVLPDCYSPSTQPSSSPSLLPTQSPSLSPSALPSLMPTLSPSVAPSGNPSSLPSLTPSSYPSPGPTSMSTIPTCEVADLKGSTFTASMVVPGSGRFCFRVELAVGGLLIVDNATKGQQNCANAKFRNKDILSEVKSLSDSTIFLGKKQNFSTYRGTIVIRDDASSLGNVEMKLIQEFSSNGIFKIDLLLPSCTAPSMSPSFAATPAPTFTPQICPWSDLEGQALYFVRSSEPDHCYKVELYVGGDFVLDTQNPNCANTVFYDEIILSVFDEIGNGGKIKFAKTATRGIMDGKFLIRKNRSLLGEVVVDDEFVDLVTFDITLTYPKECPKRQG